MPEPLDPGPPFRWDLVTPDQLGSLLDLPVTPARRKAPVDPRPSLWFLPELTLCTGKVLARSGGGDLFFVGRSLDSMFDLLGGAMAGIGAQSQPVRVPFSFQRPYQPRTATRAAGGRPFTTEELDQVRRVLAGLGLTPGELARRTRPACFVDVVDAGTTFTELFTILKDWAAAERAPWAVIRTKLRFVGVTIRGKTSPNTFRWQQHAEWTRDLPGGSVINVSLPWPEWSYFGNQQTKLTRSYRPERWLADTEGPRRDERTRDALAEAVSVVAYGGSAEGRAALARATSGEPALSEAWLRSLVGALKQGRAGPPRGSR